MDLTEVELRFLEKLRRLSSDEQALVAGVIDEMAQRTHFSHGEHVWCSDVQPTLNN